MSESKKYEELTTMMRGIDPASGVWHGLAIARESYACDIRRRAIEDCIGVLKGEIDDLPEECVERRLSLLSAIRMIEGRML